MDFNFDFELNSDVELLLELEEDMINMMDNMDDEMQPAINIIDSSEGEAVEDEVIIINDGDEW